MHDSTLTPLGRREVIAGRLAGGQPVVAAVLAGEFGVSEDAIRRDLRALAAEGACRKVYGGALPVSPAGTPVGLRAGQDLGRKRALARAALPVIAPGMTVFLDAGSTVLQLAGMLPGERGLRIVTHSLPAAAALMHRRDLSLTVIGGSVTPETGAATDARALDEIRRCRFDLCFLGACALSQDHGLAGFDPADVEVKRALPGLSGQTVLMMTNAKLGTTAPFAIAPLSAVDLYLLEADAPPPEIGALRAAGHDVKLAAPAD